MAVRLIAEEGTLAGLVLSFEDGIQWQVGRDPSQNDIVLEDKAISNSQALFFRNDKGFFLRNLDQKIPIKVNGNVIKQDTLLKDHDTILLGDTLFSLITDTSEDANDLFVFNQEDNDTQNQSEFQKEEKKIKNDLLRIKKKMSEQSKKDLRNNDQQKEKLKENIDQKQVLLSEIEKDTQLERKMEKDKKDVSKSMNNKGVKKDFSSNLQGSSQNNLDKDTDNNVTEDDKENKDKSLEGLDLSQNEKVGTLNQNSALKEKVEKDGQTTSIEKNHPIVEEAKTVKTEVLEKESKKKNKETLVNQNAFVENEDISNSEKKEAKTTFNIEDLFDFDDGIFPEVESELTSTSDSSNDYFVDLSHVSRFLLKVIAGPNIGAEYSLDLNHEYVLGSDSSKCDIIFNDLSVSHQHARLKIDNDGNLYITDLSSRNGVVVEGTHIEKGSKVIPDQFVGLGTTIFVVIDHQVPAETIVASPFLDMHEFNKSQKEAKEEKQEIQKAKDDNAISLLVDEKVQEELKKDKEKTFVSMGSLIIALCMGGFAILFGIGTASLFRSQEISLVSEGDYEEDLENVIQSFPGVKFTFNKNSGQLFLLGHIKNSIDKSELLYKLEAMSFIKSIDDNIIDDEAVWQEMNITLSKQLRLKGISMHSPEPGSFIITGYVKTDEQLNELIEFLNLHFNYISLLSNKVYVENNIASHVQELLFKYGLTGLNVNFAMGELILTGYVDNKDQENVQQLLTNLSEVSGVRNVKNFSVILPLEEGVIDLSSRYPNRYQVTGYSKHGDVNINIVINGRILMRGDTIDGMTITSIQANSVFLEKDGLKYKIDYNK